MTLHELDLRIRQLDIEISSRERQIARKQIAVNALLEERGKLVQQRRLQKEAAHVS